MDDGNVRPVRLVHTHRTHITYTHVTHLLYQYNNKYRAFVAVWLSAFPSQQLTGVSQWWRRVEIGSTESELETKTTTMTTGVKLNSPRDRDGVRNGGKLHLWLWRLLTVAAPRLVPLWTRDHSPASGRRLLPKNPDYIVTSRTRTRTL